MRKGLLVTQWPEIRLDGGGVSYADAVRREGGLGSNGRAAERMPRDASQRQDPSPQLLYQRLLPSALV